MELSWDNVLLAFALTLFAGLSTGIGSAIAFLTKKTNKKFLSLSLGFSAGVMIYVSFVEIFPTAQEALRENYSEKIADVIVAISFFAGMGLIAIIDKLIPSYENPHEVKSVECMEAKQPHDKKLMRMGIFSGSRYRDSQFPGRISDIHCRAIESRNCLPDCLCHRHTQHPGRNCRICSYFLCYRKS